MTKQEQAIYDAGVRAGRQSIKLTFFARPETGPEAAIICRIPLAGLTLIGDVSATGRISCTSFNIGTHVVRLVLDDSMPDFETYPDNE